MNELYKNQVDLLIECLPIVLKDERFALKGGTAINLFHQNLPRLSIDIDLCYLPIEDRNTTYLNIRAYLKELKNQLEKILGLSVILRGEKEAKLVAIKDGIHIKIEPNFIIRGALYPAQRTPLCERAQVEFAKEVEINCLDMADTYGGKICAALDRQHPRDLFDVKILIENGGINEKIKNAFLYYLISHPRPIHELLNPHHLDISSLFNEEFIGMTLDPVPLPKLEEIRNNLPSIMINLFTEEDKIFLISFFNNSPQWEKTAIEIVKDYPSVRWKILNQEKMEELKRKNQLEQLEELLS
ncbi:MAG: nucleotidyl transferase AbiEii/AbiGii toxin family protein [Epsilonproteobacteria bacterium]|nr:MAG: nucleotidyl transferase AbiEii/AbiGii toxin family protein [Campylobacterota bacterium]